MLSTACNNGIKKWYHLVRLWSENITIQNHLYSNPLNLTKISFKPTWKNTKISHHFLHFKPHIFPIWPKIRKCIGMQIFWNWRGWTAVKYADAHSDLVQGVPTYIAIYLNVCFNTSLGTHRCPGYNCSYSPPFTRTLSILPGN